MLSPFSASRHHRLRHELNFIKSCAVILFSIKISLAPPPSLDLLLHPDFIDSLCLCTSSRSALPPYCLRLHVFRIRSLTIRHIIVLKSLSLSPDLLLIPACISLHCLLFQFSSSMALKRYCYRLWLSNDIAIVYCSQTILLSSIALKRHRYRLSLTNLTCHWLCLFVFRLE